VGSHQAAADAYGQALALEPTNAEALLGRAAAFQGMGQQQQALDDLRKFNQAYPQDVEGFVLAAQQCFRMGLWADCTRLAEQAAALDRKNEPALRLVVEGYLAAGNPEAARLSANQLLELKASDPTNLFYHGLAHLRAGQAQAAFESLDKSIRKDPAQTRALWAMAETQLALGHPDLAMPYAEEGVRLAPTDRQAYLTRAMVHKAKLDYSAAINDYSKLTVLNPADAQAFFLRGMAYQQFNQHANAVTDFGKVASLQPDNFEALFARAASYEELADFPKAIRDYERIVEITEHNPAAKARIEQAQQRLFELNREQRPPVVELFEPRHDATRVFIPQNMGLGILKLGVADDSPLEAVLVDGQNFLNSIDSDGRYTAEVGFAGKARVRVEVRDVYQNATVLDLEVVRTETNAPVISLVAPYASDDRKVMLPTLDPQVHVEGSIQDESHIARITINGVNASFRTDATNPGFTAKIDIANQNQLRIEAEDIYGNLSQAAFELDRSAATLLADNPMGKTWVIFIENSNYRSFASLDGPAKDVVLMKEALANYEIHNIIHKKDMTKAQMERFFSIELRDLVRTNGVNSLLVWYAGHGKSINETGYWIPADANRDDEFSYFNINALKASMQSYSNYLTHTLVVTDACESGPSFYQAMRSTEADRDCNDVSATRFRSSQVFSSAGNELASDNSRFTRTFSNSLTYNDRSCIPIDRIVVQVTQAVTQSGAQSPKFGKISGLEDENGTFFFIRKD